MFERFTDRARRVVVVAQIEARGYPRIGSEHLLLGLLVEGEGVGALALAELGINLDEVRSRVEQVLGKPGPEVPGHLPFTPRAKKVLELSLREALQLGHNYTGTEHILLGICHDGEGVAAAIISACGVELTQVRQEVIRRLAGYNQSAAATDEQYRIDHDQLAAIYAAVLTEPIVQNLISLRVAARLRALGAA